MIFTNISKRIEELEWVYEKLNTWLEAEEMTAEFGMVDKIEPLVIQLRITIDKLKKED